MSFKRLSSLNGRRGAAALLGAILCALLLIPIFAANAQDKVLGAAMLEDNAGGLALGPYTLVQQDPDRKITTQSIITSGGTVLAGKQSQSRLIHLGYDGAPAWLVIKLKGNTLNDEWIVDLGRRADGRMGYLEHARAYEMILSDPLTLNEIGSERNHGAYPIRLARGEEKFLLLNVVPLEGKPTIVPMKIYSEKSYLAAMQSNNRVDIVYCILLTIFGAYFLSFASSTRKLGYILFGAYFFYCITFWLFYNGMGSQSGPGIYSEIMMLFALGFSLFTIFMTKIFWSIEYGSYTEKYILYGLIWLNVVSSFLGILLPVGDGIVHIALYYGAPGITVAIAALMSLAQSRTLAMKENFYLLGWLVLLFGLVVTVLSACKILPTIPFVLNAFWYSIIAQGGLLVMAAHRKFATTAESERNAGGEMLSLTRLKKTKDTADNSRLLMVIQKEREMLAELRMKEAQRVEEMRMAKQVADEANRAKSAFLAVVSHEIRTPMSGVMGMVRLLLDSNITKQQRDYVLTIKDSGEAMLGLLNDILDFEKIQRGKMELENISFDLHRLIQGVVTLMSGHAADKNINLSARMDEDTPRFVKGDPTRLRQILLNLMGNAIKFTEAGNVTLFIKSLNPPDKEEMPAHYEQHMVYFAVQDTGIGISAEAQANLFNPFSQADSSIARKFGGSGLGLAISKGLVEMMGSTININSKEGEGSTFFFTLEMEKGLSAGHVPAHIDPPHAQEEKPVPPMKILVVDDNMITRRVMVGFLEQGQHEVTTCSTGEEALKRINQDGFDLIFMDIELPGIKGNEAVKILRDHQNPAKSSLPVIAVTGNTAREDMERYLAEGMTGVLIKPVDIEKLKNMVREIAQKRYEREIKVPGHNLFPDIPVGENPDAHTTSATPTRQAVPEGVFNSEMLQSLKDTIGGNQLGELLGDLLTKTEEIITQLDQATKLGDLDAISMRAHELKGMAGNFGLVEISALAAQVERKAKGSELDGLGALVNTLPSASLRAQTALKDWVEN